MMVLGQLVVMEVQWRVLKGEKEKATNRGEKEKAPRRQPSDRSAIGGGGSVRGESVCLLCINARSD